MYDLCIEAVKHSYSKRVILNSGYCNFNGNSISGLIGANGQGKTTLFNIITGRIKADYLQLFYNNRRVDPQREGNKIFSYLSQGEFTPGHLKVGKLIDLMVIKNENKQFLKERFKTFKNKRVKELSVGQKRVLEIYYILHTEQPVKLLDEPFRGIDPITIEEISEFITQIEDKTIIICSHLLPELSVVTKQIYSLSDGNIKGIG